MAALIVALLLAAAPAARAHEPPAASEWRAHPVEGRLPIIRPAPDYTLVALDGRTIRPADFAGRIRIETFIYTRCADVCPLVSAKLARLQARLAARGLLGSTAVLVSITLDPGHDTAAVLGRYAASFKADARGWLWLRGAPAETRRLLAAYGGVVPPGSDLTHSDWIFLVDGENRVREIYSERLFDPDAVLTDIAALAAVAARHR